MIWCRSLRSGNPYLGPGLSADISFVVWWGYEQLEWWWDYAAPPDTQEDEHE